VFSYLVYAVLLVTLWLALWSLMPHSAMWHNGVVFDAAVLFLVSTIVGGVLSSILRMPPLVGILFVAIAWSNIPHAGYLVAGINSTFRKDCSTFALAVILIRAGLDIKPEMLRAKALQVLLFSTIPVACEVVVHSLIAKQLLSYPTYTWAFAHGAVATSVSPAVVIPSLLSLKADGFGLTRGPATLMMPSTPIEMVLQIWNINFMAELAIPGNGTPMWLNIVLAPVQIIGGIVLGVILGAIHYAAVKILFSQAEKLPNRSYTADHVQRVSRVGTVLLVIFGTAALAFAKLYNLSGGGSFAVVAMALTTASIERRRVADSRDYETHLRSQSVLMKDLWDYLSMPLLFAMLGSTVNLKTIFSGTFFPYMLICIFVGCACRMLLALAVTFREDYNVGERLVMAVGWCGKATVQATMGRTLLDRATLLQSDLVADVGAQAAAHPTQRARYPTQHVSRMLRCSLFA